VVHLVKLNVVKSQPLDIKESAEAIEGVVPAYRSACEALHTSIALEGSALVHGKNEDHSGAVSEGVVELLLVLPLSCPDIMLH